MFSGRVVQPGEPLWLPEDRELALAYEVAEREACARCGSRRQDWVNAEGEPHEPPRLMVKAKQCEGCVEVTRHQLAMEQQAQEIHGDDEMGRHLRTVALAGISLPLVPFERPGHRVKDHDEED